ncbi:MAG TPA: CehA/McbA family metallohydrolase [Polyangiaceae bacterium]|nr:CehA/McbA family metallohydrolase [Polyangiaceae bacterium]
MRTLKDLRPKRLSWPTLVALLALFLLVDHAASRRKSEGGERGRVVMLSAPRRAPDAYGRAGDLLLEGPEGATLTIGAAPNLAGHRPLLGAIIDALPNDSDDSDPLIWFRTVTATAKDEVSDLPVRSPQPFSCDGGAPGVRELGAYGQTVTTQICAEPRGRFGIHTSVAELAEGSSLVDEINVGSLPVVVDKDGSTWEAEHDTTFVAFDHGGVAMLLEARRMHVSRTFSHFGAETFPSPILVRYGAEPKIARTLTVVAGDVLTAISLLPASSRRVEVTFGQGRGGSISLRDDADHELATGTVARGEKRELRLPPNFGTYAVLTDDRGVVTDAHVALPLPGGSASLVARDANHGTITLSYRDESGAPLPVHALFKGLDTTPDPLPANASGRTYAAGRSLYLLDGTTSLAVSPGHYRVTASHGLAYSLSVRDVTVETGTTVAIVDVLRKVVDTTGWLSADFHLHSAPSPDSNVSLDERVASLSTEGVELAVATDHNRITDFRPSVERLGQGARVATAAGVEITTASPKWGHFNAYPMPIPHGAPEEDVPIYYGVVPRDLFASARSLGATILEVNHARMDPAIGYFDLVHLDPRTGRADPTFSTDFDVFEAYNGMWIETLEKVRQGALDLVALARRGKQVAAAGNSDSHKLLYEEAGYPRTWVHTDAEPAATRTDRTWKTLLARDTTVSSGPFVEMTVQGKGIGSVVSPSPDGTVHVKVRVSAPAWVPVERVEVWRDDVPIAHFQVTDAPKDGVRFERDVTISVGSSDAVVLAWADANAPLPDVVPYAHALSVGFTGLVYVDADHDGVVKVRPATP